MRLDTSTLPADLVQQCEDIGTEWAINTFYLFTEGGGKRKDWQYGYFIGEVPGGLAERRACRQLIDDAASIEWERLWEEVEDRGKNDDQF